MITGSDIEALFRSLLDIESSRIVRKTVLKSEARFKNVDMKAALKYLFLIGAAAHLKECGLGKVTPRWTVDRKEA